jgi:hypothetical protein
LPWTGDYLDGLGNRVSMLAYANPDDLQDERRRADGYGLVRFDKESERITFECWPRFSEGEQFPGWPISVPNDDNDGRQPVAWLPELVIQDSDRAVVQVVSDVTGEILYSRRVRGGRIQPPVYSAGSFSVKAGLDRPDTLVLAQLRASADRNAAGRRVIRLGT